ncbi:MAG: hypothetical protein RSC55_05205 [Oscillospiraceae bacterium]
MELSKRQHRFMAAIFFIIILEFVGTIIKIFVGPPEDRITNISMSLLCICMLAILFVPLFVNRLWHIRIPNSMYIIFVSFCFCGIMLGDVKNFYDRFARWDNILHFSSGMLLAVLGFILVNTLNQSNRTSGIMLNPFFVAAVAFCFTMTIQSLWEVFEFLSDEFLGTNAQTYMLTTTGSFIGAPDVPLVGHEALRDTMVDFMLDGLGGLIVGTIGYFDLKHGKKSFSSEALEQAE